jgi:hypothetical protein
MFKGTPENTTMTITVSVTTLVMNLGVDVDIVWWTSELRNDPNRFAAAAVIFGHEPHTR